MLIVKLAANPNGTRANQQLDFPLSVIPEGYAVVPEALEEETRRYLPWLDIETDAEGNITAVSENTAAKEAFLEAQAAAEAAEGEAEEEGNAQ